MIANIEALVPYRNELIQIFNIVSQYASTIENIQKLHGFFEKLIPYLNVPENTGSYRDWDFDNYRFISLELYLYAVAVFIKHNRFEQAANFISEDHYVGNSRYYGQEQMIDASVFINTLKSIDHRNNRLETRWLSPIGALLKERCTNVGVEFHQLMQADFVLYIRGQLQDRRGYHARWWPHTLIYAGRYYNSFEIFSRAGSRRYFDKIKVLPGIDEPANFEPLLDDYRTGERRAPQWQFDRVDPAILLNFEQLAKRL